jgi:type I restriction enzyme R subunit
MSLHHEINLEDEICAHLGANGWIYEAGAAARYDRARALFPDDLIAWIKESQPEAWDALTRTHGGAAAEVLLDRLRKQFDDRGALDVLRHGVELVGLRRPLALAQFRPALSMNAEIMARYQANKLRVVRQVRYSAASEASIDLVLFLNGAPMATVELKSDFTQSVKDAIDQYKFDRPPRPKGQGAEPLLTFPSGALVHFALSNSEAFMATKLKGPETRFLPFNKGDHGAAGNPPNPNGHATAYVWEDIWARDSWLEILGRYVVAQKDEKKQIASFIFPRYHQLDVTRRLVEAVRTEGPGGKYLIQHSAGSGKTNSIAWSAHLLADLHDETNEKIFSTVIVVSDRTVVDDQLQEALADFERRKGVVEVIKNKGASKSGQLAQALADGKKIIVCTIQTFPFALGAVREMAATQGKRFAVIADEAHSSQTGQTAAKLKSILSPEQVQDMEDGGEFSAEDVLAAQMAARAGADGVTYVAFTATPKAKTLEIFGRRPDPSRPAGEGNLPEPFHVYSMRQAIEEEFILDVLENYTPYKLAFRLAHNGKEWDETEVDRNAATKGIMQWVRLHPYNISQKVRIVVEHYRETVAPLLNGRAKAMVVLASRKEAVRWKLAIDKYIRDRGYDIGSLVAFSGEVNDQESGPDPFKEVSMEMNPGLKGRNICDVFATEDYHLLLVANKFQTGFNQPLLCGMYVDRRLAGIQAVQTLSRLNRAHPGKDTTYILDFMNGAGEILKAFQTYYETARLEDVTDPNIVFNMRAKLDAAGYCDDYEVDRVAKVEIDSRSRQSDLVAAINPVSSRLLAKYKTARDAFVKARERDDEKGAKAAQDEMDALILFKADMSAFLRVYTFLSQMIDYANPDIEKRARFYRRLVPLLEFGRERDEIDLSKVTLTHHTLKKLGTQAITLEPGEWETLPPITELGSGSLHEKEKALLAEIIDRVNGLFVGDLSTDDQLVYVNNVLKGKLLESEELASQADNNSKAQFNTSPTISVELTNAIMDAMAAHEKMSRQALGSEKIREALKEILLGPGQLWEALRARSAAGPAQGRL